MLYLSALVLLAATPNVDPPGKLAQFDEAVVTPGRVLDPEAGRAASMTPYDVDLVPHLVGTAGLMAVLGTVQGFVRPSMKGGLTCGAPAGESRCDPSVLNDLDRSVVGKKNNDLLLASDVSFGVLVLAGLVQTATDAWTAPSRTPGRDFLTDFTVILETTLVATGVAQALKYAIRRPRPTQFAEVGSIASVEHQLSFPGGHGTSAAALAAATATTFWLRHPESPWRWLVLGTTSAAALFTGVSRTEAGFHFYTDTIAGFLLGATIGWLLPYTLRRTDAGLMVAPAIGPHGGGATVGWSF
jgi:membrane-associated phospholipid phosphatase